MTLNCKPGDIAIVVSPSANAGAVVSVIQSPDMHTHPTGLFCWEVESLGGPFKTYAHGLVVEACIPDAWLKPVSGLPLQDEVTDEVTT